MLPFQYINKSENPPTISFVEFSVFVCRKKFSLGLSIILRQFSLLKVYMFHFGDKTNIYFTLIVFIIIIVALIRSEVAGAP